jgi:hypothetical protein
MIRQGFHVGGAMNTALPLTGSPLTLHRLANVYLLSFWILFASFAISAIQAGYDPALAIMACSFAGIACMLLRMERRTEGATTAASPPNVVLAKTIMPSDKYVLAVGQLTMQIDELLREARDKQEHVGLLLLRTQGEAKNVEIGSLFKQLVDTIGSSVLVIDSQTIAMPDSRKEVGPHLYRLAMALQSRYRAQRTSHRAQATTRLILGIAVARHPETSAADLIVEAKSAIRQAEAKGRDVLISHL